MRIGIFTDRVSSLISTEQLLKSDNHEVIGVSVVEDSGLLPCHIKHFDSPCELLRLIDAAVFLSPHANYSGVVEDAIRRGIPTFLADLPYYTLRDLQNLRVLCNESETPLGFGFAGIDICNYSKEIGDACGALFVNYNREVAQSMDADWFRRILAYDLATIVRVNPGVSRRLTVAAFPFAANGFKLVSVRVDFVRGGVFCYTLSRLASKCSLYVDVFGNGMKAIVGIPQSFLNPKTNELFPFDPFSPTHFIESLERGSHYRFSVEQAIDTLTLLEECDDKLRRYY